MSGEVRGRGNGLSAPTYTLLVSVPPPDVDRLLGVLAADGVAAYATTDEANAGQVVERDAGQPEGEAPEAPTDPAGPMPGPPAAAAAPGASTAGTPERAPSSDGRQLFVDSAQLLTARRALARILPAVEAALARTEQDAAFAAIVAGWDTDGERTWPDAEDLPDLRLRGLGGSAPAVPPVAPSPAGPPRRRAGDTPRRPPADGTPGGRDATIPRPAGRDHEDGPEAEHYVAPPPPPLPRLTPLTLLTVAALALGLALLLFPTLLGVAHSSTLDVLGVGCIVGAVAGLVARMRTTRVDDGPDDGAVV